MEFKNASKSVYICRIFYASLLVHKKSKGLPFISIYFIFQLLTGRKVVICFTIMKY